MRNANYPGRGRDVNESGNQHIFELWDMRSRNQLASFQSEDEALSTVRRLSREHGPAYVTQLALGHEDLTGTSKLIATGDDLVRRAESQRLTPPR
jgi:hypothetical protein